MLSSPIGLSSITLGDMYMHLYLTTQPASIDAQVKVSDKAAYKLNRLVWHLLLKTINCSSVLLIQLSDAV